MFGKVKRSLLILICVSVSMLTVAAIAEEIKAPFETKPRVEGVDWAAKALKERDEAGLPKLRVGFASYYIIPCWIRGYYQLVTRGRELGLEVIGIVGEEGFEHEIAGLESLMERGVEVIVISGCPPEMAAPIIKEAHKRGLKCVMMDAFAPGVSSVGAPDPINGTLAAYYLLNHGRGQGNYVEYVIPGHHLGVDQRIVFYELVMKYHPKARIVAKPGASFPGPRVKAYEDLRRLLIAYPERGSIQGVFTPFEDVGVGPAHALLDTGRTEIALSSIVAGVETMRCAKEGLPAGSADQNFFEQGKAVAEIAALLAAGKEYEDLPWRTIVPTRLVSPEAGNLDEFIEFKAALDEQGRELLKLFIIGVGD